MTRRPSGGREGVTWRIGSLGKILPAPDTGRCLTRAGGRPDKPQSEPRGRPWWMVGLVMVARGRFLDRLLVCGGRASADATW